MRGGPGTLEDPWESQEARTVTGEWGPPRQHPPWEGGADVPGRPRGHDGARKHGAGGPVFCALVLRRRAHDPSRPRPEARASPSAGAGAVGGGGGRRAHTIRFLSPRQRIFLKARRKSWLKMV